jgi:protein transport protein SEC24
MAALVAPGSPRPNSNSSNPSEPPPLNYNPNSNPNLLADNLSNLNLNRPPSMPSPFGQPLNFPSSAPLPGVPSGSPPFSTSAFPSSGLPTGPVMLQAPSMRSLLGSPAIVAPSVTPLQPTPPFSASPQGVPPPPGSYGQPTWPRHPGQVMNIFHSTFCSFFKD